MTLSKSDIVLLATRMGVNPKGFKKDICRHITQKVQSNASEKYKNTRRKFVKMMALLANKQS